MASDISDDTLTSTITAQEKQSQFNTEQQRHHFRSVAFYGSCIIVVLFLLALLFWLVWWPIHSFDLHEFAGGIEDPKKYAGFISQTKTLWTLGIVVLAAIPTTLALALLRFAFSSNDSKDKDSDIPSVWLSLAKEVADVMKDYIKSKN